MSDKKVLHIAVIGSGGAAMAAAGELIQTPHEANRAPDAGVPALTRARTADVDRAPHVPRHSSAGTGRAHL